MQRKCNELRASLGLDELKVSARLMAVSGASDSEPIGVNETPSTEADVVVPTYYTNALNWAYEKGIMMGDVDPATGARLNTLRPNDGISRQELALIVWRASGEPAATDLSAYDAVVDAGSEWESASAALAWTAQHGILTGFVESDGLHLRPEAEALRGQAAKIFAASLGFLA